MSDLSDIWSLEAAAAHFGCSTKHVQKMTREEGLPYFMMGRLWRFPRLEVLAWERARMKNSKEVA